MANLLPKEFPDKVHVTIATYSLDAQLLIADAPTRHGDADGLEILMSTADADLNPLAAVVLNLDQLKGLSALLLLHLKRHGQEATPC